MVITNKAVGSGLGQTNFWRFVDVVICNRLKIGGLGNMRSAGAACASVQRVYLEQLQSV